MSKNYLEFKAYMSEASLAEKGGGMWLSKGQFLSLSRLSSSNKPGRLPCTQAANRGVLG